MPVHSDLVFVLHPDTLDSVRDEFETRDTEVAAHSLILGVPLWGDYRVAKDEVLRGPRDEVEAELARRGNVGAGAQ